MKNNTQQFVHVLGWARRKKRVVGAVCGAVVLLGGITAVVVYAMPNAALNQIEAGSQYGGRSPNPGSMLLYKNGSFWGSSFANPDPGISTGTGLKHILKNQDSGQIRTITLKSYYGSDVAARAAVYQVQRGICNFEANEAGSSVSRRLRIYMNGDPTPRFDRFATAGNEATVCSEFQNFQFSLGAWPGLGFDVGSGLYYNQITFALEGDAVGVVGQKNQVRFQVRHSSGAGTMGMAATDRGDQFGLVEGGADSEAPSAERYGVATGIRFGKPCYDNSTASGMISVYDGDVGKFGVQHVFVLRRNHVTGVWERLGLGDTSHAAGAVAWDASMNRWDITSTNRNTASIWLNNFSNTYDYMLVYDNPVDNGSSLAPQGNVISLGIPGDTIHGEVFTNCKYNLTPYVGGLTSPSFVGNYTNDVTGTITNSEVNTIWHDKTPPWRITKAIFPSNPNRAGTGTGLTTVNNCAWLMGRGANAGSCTEIAGAGDTIRMPATSAHTVYGDSGNVPVGSYVCYVTSIWATQYMPSTPPNWMEQWRHSDMTCAVSVKKPSMGVTYGDVRTGGSFDSCRINLAAVGDKAKYHGITMADYGGGVQHSYVNGSALSVGTIENFASLTSVLPGGGTTTMRGHFARGPNATAPTGLFYGDINGLAASSLIDTHCLAPVFEPGRYPTSTVSALPVGNAPIVPAAGTTTYTYSLGGVGTLNLGNINVGTNQRVVIRVTGSGTVILNGNITYSGAATNIYELPQFTLLADGAINIVVADGVSRLEGIYAGKGDFYTCQTYANFRQVMATQCTTELKIYGSVIVAGRLYPHRTLGHDIPTDMRSAELFNLRPDILLSDYSESGLTPGLSISSQLELAPRY